MTVKNSWSVYQIVCLTEKKSYVGLAKTFRQRISTHKKALNSATHHCFRLQEAYNKYGLNDFIFSLVEENLSYIDAVYLEAEIINQAANEIYNTMRPLTKKQRNIDTIDDNWWAANSPFNFNEKSSMVYLDCKKYEDFSFLKTKFNLHEVAKLNGKNFYSLSDLKRIKRKITRD